MAIRLSEDLQTVVWSKKLIGPRYTGDYQNQGIGLSSEGLVVLTGTREPAQPGWAARSLVSFLSWENGTTISAKHYGLAGAGSGIQRVEPTHDGGLLFLGEQNLPGSRNQLTYMVKAGPRGESDCPLRESDIEPALQLLDASIGLRDLVTPPPMLTLSVLTEESFLELTPWALHEYLQCEEEEAEEY